MLRDEKYTWLAVLLSIVLPGVGQLYVGDEYVKATAKGVAFLVGFLVALLLSACTLGITLLLYFPFWVWAAVDAYLTAEEHNRAASRRVSFPEYLDWLSEELLKYYTLFKKGLITREAWLKRKEELLDSIPEEALARAPDLLYRLSQLADEKILTQEDLIKVKTRAGL